MSSYDYLKNPINEDQKKDEKNSPGFFSLSFWLGFSITLIIALSVGFLIEESKLSDSIRSFERKAASITSQFGSEIHKMEHLLSAVSGIVKVSEYEMGIDWQSNVKKIINELDTNYIKSIEIIDLNEQISYSCATNLIYGERDEKSNFCNNLKYLSEKRKNRISIESYILKHEKPGFLYVSNPIYYTPLIPTETQSQIANQKGWLVLTIDMMKLIDKIDSNFGNYSVELYRGSDLVYGTNRYSKEKESIFYKTYPIITEGYVSLDGMDFKLKYSWGYVIDLLFILEIIIVSLVLSVLVGSLISILYRKRNESQKMLYSVNETLTHVLSSTPGAIYVRENLDDWKFTYLSSRFKEITGFKQIHIEKRSDFYSLIHDEDLETIKNLIKDGMENYGQYEVEYRIINCNRQPIWVLDKGFLDEDKKLVRGVIIDINRTKKIEETTKQLNDALIHMADGIALLNPQGKIQGVNLTLQNIFKTTKNKLLDSNLCDFIHKDDQHKINEAFEKIHEINKIEIDVRGTVSKEQESIFLSIIMVPIRDSKLKIKGAYTFIKDVSIRKKHENQLKEANNQIAEAYKIKSEFFALMSHRMRSPMNVIMGYCDMLIEELDKSEDKHLVTDMQQIEASAKNLLLLVEDIIDISKLESGNIIVNNNIFAVSDIVENSVSRTKNKLNERHNEIEISIDSEINFMNSDFNKIEQNLVNLLSNAAKFTDNGKISLTVSEREPGKIYFIVKDSGVGIDKDKLDKLFKPFAMFNESQLDNSSNHTGLGLAITHRFCQLLGGDLLVESQTGKGSTFIMIIPKGNIGIIQNKSNIVTQI